MSTRQRLRDSGLRPHKQLGQNFLVHAGTANRIVELAALEAEDEVIEVGVGLGALTRPLAARVRSVIGLEADAGIIRLHAQEQNLPHNLRLVHADALKIDLAALAPPGKRLKLIANLPYSISSPFVFRLIAHAELMHEAVLLLQKEFALRLMAGPGNKIYGAPSVLLAACAQVEALLSLGPEQFHPRPKVDSLLLRLCFYPQPARVLALGEFDRGLFTRVVRLAFGQRRKTLANSLHGLMAAGEKAVLLDCLRHASISPQARAERLDLEDYVRLTRALAQARSPMQEHTGAHHQPVEEL